MPKTIDICRGLRKEVAIAAAVPEIASRSIPVPFVRHGTPLLGFLFYLISGKASECKAIHPPVAMVTVSKESGKVVDLKTAPFFWPEGNSPRTVLGMFPNAQMRGLSVENADRWYESYYEACDQLLEETGHGSSMETCPSFGRWMQEFRRVKEEGFDDYFVMLHGMRTLPVSALTAEQTAPGSLAREIAPASPATAPDPGSPQREGVDVVRIMAQLRKMILDNKKDNLLAEWRNIYRLMNGPQFSIAIVGECTRGKSTLLNNLLGTDIIPTGDVPTTRLLTQVVYGSEKGLWKTRVDGARQKCVATDKVIADLMAHEPMENDRTILRLELPVQWLSKCGIVFVDTPGVADSPDRRTVLVTEAIAACDAALVTVSATMPLSLTERAFIEDHILVRSIPRVAVVITRLDQVVDSERARLIEYVRSKLKEWGLETEVWSSYAPPILPVAAGVEVAGKEAIVERLSLWALNPQHYDIRARQVLGQAAALAKNLRDSLLIERNVLFSSEKDREVAKKAANIDADRLRMDWEDIRIELDKRAGSCESILEHILSEAEQPITGRLSYELNHSGNPKDWWERDFPFRLKSELQAVIRGIDLSVERKIAEDTSWLSEQVRTRFSRGIAVGRAGALTAASEGEKRMLNVAIQDLSRRRTLLRVGSLAVTAGSYLILGPFAVIMSGLAGLYVEKKMTDKIEEQRKVITKELAQTVARILSLTTEEGFKRLRAYYKSVLKHTQQEEALWFESRRQAVIAGSSGADVPGSRLEEAIAAAEELVRQLGRD